MSQPHIVILGAGPAGLGAAFQLRRRAAARATVLEQRNQVGGNAGSFDLAGMRVDYGSHRLHPACDPKILQDIRTLLGNDLLDRPRHGRIRLCGRWIHFPLKPVDLALGLPASFSFGVAADLLKKAVNGQRSAVNGQQSAVRLRSSETFASVLEKGLGRTICDHFYFPYVQKIWGLKPEELAVTLAQRRISANSLAKMTRKIFTALSASKGDGRGRFFYPRQGYGQISEAYYRGAQDAGADIRLSARVQSVEIEGTAVRVAYQDRDGKTSELDADYVWSTIPITVLAKCLKPAVPHEVLQAAEVIRYRAMILIYLVLEQHRFSEFDAHYFPEASIPISRLSEPKNYGDGSGPKHLTVLCAELPCDPDGPHWQKSDEELGQLVRDALSAAGIPVRATINQIITRRVRQAYPIYERGYETYFNSLDHWLDRIDGLLTFGRQGLFAHDNTHHALYMAYSAVDCLDESGCFNRERWQSFRRIFDSHVVED
jgi:protoporphyrinogen oxidase